MRDETDKGPSCQLTVDGLQRGMARIENYRQSQQTTTTVGNRFEGIERDFPVRIEFLRHPTESSQ
jgi:hypothetical protein